MGRWFAEFFAGNGVEVRIVDKSPETKAIANQIGVGFLNTNILNVTEGEAAGNEEIVDTDVLLVSVPIDITGRVIERVGPKMHGDSLLMDITSVKKNAGRDDAKIYNRKCRNSWHSSFVRSHDKKYARTNYHFCAVAKIWSFI